MSLVLDTSVTIAWLYAERTTLAVEEVLKK